MKCRRVLDLISPYVDERLTGEQMLEIRRHIDGCASCAHEYTVQREVKILLRSAAMREPGQLFEARLRTELAVERHSAVPILFPALTSTNRGRRMAYAMALSCVGIFSLAHATSSKMGISGTPMPAAMDARIPTAIVTDLQGQSITTAFRQPEAPTSQAGVFFVRRQDEPRRAYTFVGGFSSPMNAFPTSSVTFAGYPTH